MNSLVQLLSRDLGRVKEDAFALEQRLDQALEEDRLNREALEEERADQTPTLQAEQEREQEQGRRGSEGLPTSTVQGEEYGTRSVGEYGGGDDGQAWNGNDMAFHAQQHGGGYGVPPFEAERHEYAAEAMPQRGAQDEEVVVDDGRAEVSGASHEYGGGGHVDEGSVGVGSEEQEADFVGEDEEDNVWQ